MRIYRHNEIDLSAALGELSDKLRLGAGITSPSSDRKTVEVFGEPLSPLEVVRRILGDVRERGDAAVREYARKLDGADLSPERFAVCEEEIDAAWAATPESLKRGMETAAANIRKYQSAIRIPDAAPVTNAQGGRLSVRYSALERVGICVPGGRAAYPSTVLMTALPAQVAGVKEIAIVSPCGADGKARPETLAAARVAGVTEIYRVGGAQAVAALAYGTETIRRVEKIAGPGNVFVTLAKKEVYGEVGIDLPAGPSEVLIIADRTANARFIAADMLSQAEHDPAAAVLLTPEVTVAERTVDELGNQLARLSREQAARDCLERFGFVGVTADMDEAVALANRFAPEHLEVATERPEELLPRLTAAGAIFLGQFTPEPVGDYLAGPSHVLPTGVRRGFSAG